MIWNLSALGFKLFPPGERIYKESDVRECFKRLKDRFPKRIGDKFPHLIIDEVAGSKLVKSPHEEGNRYTESEPKSPQVDRLANCPCEFCSGSGLWTRRKDVGVDDVGEYSKHFAKEIKEDNKRLNEIYDKHKCNCEYCQRMMR